MIRRGKSETGRTEAKPTAETAWLATECRRAYKHLTAAACCTPEESADCRRHVELARAKLAKKAKVETAKEV